MVKPTGRCAGLAMGLNAILTRCPRRNPSNWVFNLESTPILIISYRLVQLLAHFPRSLRCGDRVRLQSYFFRASVVGSMPANDPSGPPTGNGLLVGEHRNLRS